MIPFAEIPDCIIAKTYASITYFQGGSSGKITIRGFIELPELYDDIRYGKIKMNIQPTDFRSFPLPISSNLARL
jgi:hypothetical protein